MNAGQAGVHFFFGGCEKVEAVAQKDCFSSDKSSRRLDCRRARPSVFSANCHSSNNLQVDAPPEAILNRRREMPHPVATTGHPRKLDRRPALATSAFETFGPLAVLLGTFVLSYWHVILKLVHDWANDDNYSHGFLIVPLALYLVWERRDRLDRKSTRLNSSHSRASRMPSSA